MTFGTILNYANYLLGGNERRQVSLSVDETELIFPVTPERYSVQTAQINKIVSILDLGEALIFGTPKLKRIKFGSFFPSLEHGYPFTVDDGRTPEECLNLLTKWKEAKEPCRLIIGDSPINLVMAIQELDYREQDGTRDIYFELSLSEWRDLNVPPAEYQKEVEEETGLKKRPGEATPTKQQKAIKEARDILEAAKVAYGTYKDVKKLQTKNGLEHLLLKTGRIILTGGKVDKAGGLKMPDRSIIWM